MNEDYDPYADLKEKCDLLLWEMELDESFDLPLDPVEYGVWAEGAGLKPFESEHQFESRDALKTWRDRLIRWHPSKGGEPR